MLTPFEQLHQIPNHDRKRHFAHFKFRGGTCGEPNPYFRAIDFIRDIHVHFCALTIWRACLFHSFIF